MIMKKEKRTTTLIVKPSKKAEQARPSVLLVMVDDKRAAQRISDFAEKHGSIVAQIRRGKMRKLS